MKSIQLIEPAGSAHSASLLKNINQLSEAGFEAIYEPLKVESSWPYTSASRDARLAQLLSALNGSVDYILAARGGYGVSDLLPFLDWHSLKKVRPKTIIGFSDITALQNAVYLQLGWQGLHAPMPGSTLWGHHKEDIDMLLGFLGKNHPWSECLSLTLLAGQNQNLVGRMVGGCFSVLTNLIATPYFKLTPKENILLLEDINEHPARLLRFWNQWHQAGIATGFKAVVLGRLTDFCEPNEYTETKLRLAKQMHLVSGVPIYSTESFGHCSPNMPFGIGAEAILDLNGKLGWTIR